MWWFAWDWSPQARVVESSSLKGGTVLGRMKRCDLVGGEVGFEVSRVWTQVLSLCHMIVYQRYKPSVTVLAPRLSVSCLPAMTVTDSHSETVNKLPVKCFLL